MVAVVVRQAPNRRLRKQHIEDVRAMARLDARIGDQGLVGKESIYYPRFVRLPPQPSR